MRAHLLLLLLVTLLPLALAAPVSPLGPSAAYVYENVSLERGGTIVAGQVRAYVLPAYEVRLDFIDPADVYVIRCGSSCDANYIRSRLLRVFAPGVYINPNIPVRDGYAYVPVFAAVYRVDPSPYYLTAVEGSFLLNNEVSRFGPELVVLSSDDPYYTGTFRVRFPNQSRDLTVFVSLTVDNRGLVYLIDEHKPTYYLATDGFFVTDQPDIFTYRSDMYYEDSCISFDRGSAVLLTPSTRLNLFDCDSSGLDQFTIGHNYQTRRYAAFAKRYGSVSMSDLNIHIVNSTSYLSGLLSISPDYIDLSASVQAPPSLLSPEGFANLAFAGIAGLTGIIDVIELVPLLALGPVGAVALFLLSFTLTFFILRWTYNFVKERNPKLLPFYWLMVVLFGDIGAIIAAVLALLF